MPDQHKVVHHFAVEQKGRTKADGCHVLPMPTVQVNSMSESNLKRSVKTPSATHPAAVVKHCKTKYYEQFTRKTDRNCPILVQILVYAVRNMFLNLPDP